MVWIDAVSRSTTNRRSLAGTSAASSTKCISRSCALPENPLIAFVPVNVRPEGDEGGGNTVGAILASMGTDVADPVDRLRAVAASTRAGKAQLQGMSQAAMVAYGLALVSPLAVQSAVAATGLRSPLPLAFNVIVSNVPGPRETRYFRGSRLEAMYPVSIPMHGVALNVTFKGYADTLNFGFVGDRDTVQHLQLAVHTGEALRELCAALGVDGDEVRSGRPAPEGGAAAARNRRRSRGSR
jgi:WS/DGAT/MGAT family acyltransferase